MVRVFWINIVIAKWLWIYSLSVMLKTCPICPVYLSGQSRHLSWLYCFCYIHLLVVLVLGYFPLRACMCVCFFVVGGMLFRCFCCAINLWSFLLLSWNLLMWPMCFFYFFFLCWYYVFLNWGECLFGYLVICVLGYCLLCWYDYGFVLQICLIWYWVYVVCLLIGAWYLMFIGVERHTVNYVWLWVMVMVFLHVRSLVWLVGFGFEILYLISTFRFIN